MIISNLQVYIKHRFLISKSIYYFSRHCPFVLCWLRPPVLHCDHEPPDWPGSQWHQGSDGDCQEGVNNLSDQHDQRDDGPPLHLHIQALCAKVDKKYLWRVNLNSKPTKHHCIGKCIGIIIGMCYVPCAMCNSMAFCVYKWHGMAHGKALTHVPCAMPAKYEYKNTRQRN